jgi:hypothetical protein
MKVKLLFFVCFLVLTFTSFAQQKKGDQVINFNGNFTKPENTDGMLTLNFNYGKFFTDHFEGGLLDVASLTAGTFMNATGLYANYNFLANGATLVPYLGIYATSLSISSDAVDMSGLTYGGKAGIRKYVSEKTFLDGNFAYENQSFDEIDQSQFAVNIGFGIIIGRKE